MYGLILHQLGDTFRIDLLVICDCLDGWCSIGVDPYPYVVWYGMVGKSGPQQFIAGDFRKCIRGTPLLRVTLQKRDRHTVRLVSDANDLQLAVEHALQA